MTAEAVHRAQHLLASTSLFRELGLDELAADSRAVARMALDLADDLEAERSARVTLQARCERLQAIIGQAAYSACVRERAT